MLLTTTQEVILERFEKFVDVWGLFIVTCLGFFEVYRTFEISAHGFRVFYFCSGFFSFSEVIGTK